MELGTFLFKITNQTKRKSSDLNSPDWRENPPDFSSGDLEGKRENGNLKKPKRFGPKNCCLFEVIINYHVDFINLYFLNIFILYKKIVSFSKA
jgi:hypothetical protein